MVVRLPDVEDESLLAIRLDRYVAVALGIYGLLLATYLFGLPPELQAAFDENSGELIFLVMLVALLGRSIYRADSRNIRIFWSILTAGYCAWLFIDVYGLLIDGDSSIRFEFIKDILFLFHTATIAVAIELRLDTFYEKYWLQRRGLYAIGGSLLVIAMYGYFAILPIYASSNIYTTPYFLYAALDTYIAVRFLRASVHSTSESWRRLYAAFGVAFLLIVAADVLSWTFRTGYLDYVPGSWVNLGWYAWYVVAFIASSLTVVNDRGRHIKIEPYFMTPATSGLMVVGLAIPFIHTFGYGSGMFDVDVREARMIFVAIWIVGITSILYMLHAIVIRNVKQLDIGKTKAENKADQFERQLERELRIRSLGRLSAGLAHDFGNTVSAIAMHAKAIENNKTGSNSAKQQIKGLTQAIQYAQDLVTKLSLFGGSRESITVETFDLEAEIRKTIEVIRPSLGEGIALDWQSGTSPLLINAEKTMVHQVLANYLYNAIDAVDDRGHIHVTAEIISTGFQCASCSEVTSGRFVAMAVTDDGPGIDSTLAENVFEPLITSKPVGKGSGLGLSTVHGVMHKIGGHVGLVVHPESGTTFIGYFPQPDAPPG